MSQVAGEEAREREPVQLVKTGIEGLDEVIGGGFIKGRTYLVAGETGTGKTLFSLNYLIYGALHGEPGIYLLVDEDYDDLIGGAKSFGWDLEVLIGANMISVMNLLPDFIEKSKNKPLESLVRTIVGSLAAEARRIGAQRLVIDPIAPLIVGDRDVVWMREYIRSLVTSIERQVGTTTVITSEIPTGSNQLSRFGVEEFLASGIIVLGLRREGGRYYRTLFVRKMRWRPAHPAMYYMEIKPGRGIVVGREVRL